MPKLCSKNEIQNGGHRNLEFISGGYFTHTAERHTNFRTNISIHDRIIITFKIKDGGRISCWIFENLIINQRITLGC